ncbi:hypothetical protein M8C21_026911 [Ambrosia artemisiifolia]|uniref:Jacalin-type lectin domain-containing protein n=1 Tax=Ambrosia artemisiifolia TaxID=4212 RepID=A0AAD5GUT9_AMBAR|nr:hypothetical protein M8C21_026911 [Ambrosia artemisiifolia]
MAASDNAVMFGPWGRTFTGKFWKYELPELPIVLGQETAIIIRYKENTPGINYIKVVPLLDKDNIENQPEGSGPVVGDTTVILLGADEFIKEFTFGFSEPDAKYLSWIYLVDNKNQQHGPFGTLTTPKFSFTVTKGKLVGFFGWNEGPISSFGVELASSDNVVMVGPWGLNEGITWHHQVKAQCTNIIINYGVRVNRITVDPDENSGKNKDNIKHHLKRSGDGDYIKEITLGPDECIKDCFVFVKPDTKCLSALGLSTNKDMYGTYGTVDDTSVFPLPVTKGKLLGFFGNNEVPINSIGFEFAP